MRHDESRTTSRKICRGLKPQLRTRTFRNVMKFTNKRQMFFAQPSSLGSSRLERSARAKKGLALSIKPCCLRSLLSPVLAFDSSGLERTSIDTKLVPCCHSLEWKLFERCALESSALPVTLVLAISLASSRDHCDRRKVSLNFSFKALFEGPGRIEA